jgi:hypothetical protein
MRRACNFSIQFVAARGDLSSKSVAPVRYRFGLITDVPDPEKTLASAASGIHTTQRSPPNGPSPENTKVTLAGTEYVLATLCKPHDCAEHNTVLLYAASPTVVYGKVFRRGRSTLLGAPPPAVARELERLWRDAYISDPMPSGQFQEWNARRIGESPGIH